MVRKKRQMIFIFILLTLPLLLLWICIGSREKATKRELLLPAEHTPAFALFSPNGRFFVSHSTTGEIDLWDLWRPGTRYVFDGHFPPVQPVFSADSRLMVFLSEQGFITLQRISENKAEKINRQSDRVRAIALDMRHHRLALAESVDRNVILWDYVSEKEEQRIEEEVWHNSLVFTPDGNTLIFMCVDGNLKRWALKTNEVETIGRDAQILTTPVYISPTGEHIAYGTDRSTIRLWNVSKKTVLSISTNASLFITSLSFSPDGSMIASSADEGLLSFWEMGTGKLVGAFSERRPTLGPVCFSPDRKTFAYHAGRMFRIVSTTRIPKYPSGGNTTKRAPKSHSGTGGNCFKRKSMTVETVKISSFLCTVRQSNVNAECSTICQLLLIMENRDSLDLASRFGKAILSMISSVY